MQDRHLLISHLPSRIALHVARRIAACNSVLSGIQQNDVAAKTNVHGAVGFFDRLIQFI